MGRRKSLHPTGRYDMTASTGYLRVNTGMTGTLTATSWYPRDEHRVDRKLAPVQVQAGFEERQHAARGRSRKQNAAYGLAPH